MHRVSLEGKGTEEKGNIHRALRYFNFKNEVSNDLLNFYGMFSDSRKIKESYVKIRGKLQ
jgi:hypothetical protein